MPPARRQQQHRNQQPRRNKGIQSREEFGKVKPPFPMNLFTNSSMFVIVGLGVMIFSLVGAYIFTANNDGPTTDTPPTSTPEGGATAEATETPTAQAMQFEQAEQVVNAATTDYQATITTAKGEITVDLLEDVAPNTVNSFVFLAQQGYFDNITFHRVVPDFVIQAGDPTGSGSGGPGYTTEEEPNDLLNTRGMLSMAKTQGATDFGSQWFINTVDNPPLDDPNSQAGRFYPFAEVTGGMEVVDEIAQGDVIQSITITETPKDAAPEATASASATAE